MGLDVVAIVMAVEDAFKITIPQQSMEDLWRGRKDIQVRDFIAMTNDLVKKQHPDFKRDVGDATRCIISEFSGGISSLVPLDAWFRQDLDLI